MLRLRIWFAGLTAFGLSLAGCGPEVPREELGEVLFKLPALPGTEKPYPLPELEQPPADEAAANEAAAGDPPLDAAR